MWKKLVSIMMVLAFISFFMIPSAEAGSKQRNRWEGIGIALGAVALGAMAYRAFTQPPQPQVVYSRPPEPQWYPPRPEYVPGHWEMIRERVPGGWERVWVPGYRDRWGNWVAGHYEDHQTPGCYVERRVWVEGYYRHN